MTSSLSRSEDAFDFAKHRSAAVEKYRGLKGLYEAFSSVVREVLRATIPAEYQIQSIDARAKDVDSFGDKAALPSDSDPSAPRYPEPLSGITDLAGVRVIVFFPKTLRRVNEVVSREFDVVEKTDKAEELIASDRFGYQSIHYLVKLKASRTDLPEYSRYKELIAEIQLRTILQHAWAEMEHDIQYKSVSAMPPLIRRRFMSLAGMLEIADREFQTIQDEDERVRSQVREDEDLERVVKLQPTVARTEAQAPEPRPFLSNYVPGSARALLDKGSYLEAVRAYDELIEEYPTVHTNYIGRARAKFLAGDREGALVDLSIAEGLYPADPVIERLRQQIGEGQTLPSYEYSMPGHDEVVDGNQRLASGDAVGALAKYSKARERGWLGVYSKFNCAMAHCLANEPTVALALLSEITPDHGSFMEVNMLGLRMIAAIQTEASNEMQVEMLQDLRNLSRMHEFAYHKSPIRHLEAGLRSLPGYEKYSVVFRALKGDTDYPVVW